MAVPVPGKPIPSMFSRRSLGAPTAQITAWETAQSRGSLEQPGDLLRGLVVGRYPGTHQTLRGRQIFKDVDPHPTLSE
jgi:hypothetical protein